MQYDNFDGPNNGYFRVALQSPMDKASEAAALREKRLDIVWQLNLEGYTRFNEILQQAEERYELKMTRDELRDISQELMNRVEQVGEDED